MLRKYSCIYMASSNRYDRQEISNGELPRVLAECCINVYSDEGICCVQFLSVLCAVFSVCYVEFLVSVCTAYSLYSVLCEVFSWCYVQLLGSVVYSS